MPPLEFTACEQALHPRDLLLSNLCGRDGLEARGDFYPALAAELRAFQLLEDRV